MELTIFYSWQTNTITKYNKNFIHSCIEKATKQLKGVAALKDVTFLVTEGVTGEPGSPSVAAKIKEERVRNCDIFIADISVTNYQRLNWFVRSFDKLVGRKFRPTQNNNVIMEYGVAFAHLGAERIIGVLNKSYGSPNENPDNIPFDIRALRFPIEYEYDESKLAGRDDIQKALVDDLKKAIKDVAIYALEHYKTKYQPFLVWELWQNYVPKEQGFVTNGKINEIYDSIKKSVEAGNKIIRVLGLSGLGKTRIIFELFRPAADDESRKFSGRALYLDYNNNTEINIIGRIEEILQSKNEHLVVLDNCPVEICRSLKTRIKQHPTKVSLITIDNNPEEKEDNFIQDVEYISIGKEDLTTVVDEIIKADFNDLPADSIEKIKEFSQGIPMMAVLLGDSARKGEKFLGKLDDKDLLEKLLGDFGQETERKTLLRTSALFNFFGFEGEFEPQLKFMATNQQLTVTNNQPQVSEQLFREVVKHYLSRQIFEQKGRLLGMRPFPLAIYLAAEWLEQCTDERLLEVIAALAQLEAPHGKQLSEAFAEQMKFLGFSSKANTIIEKITAPGAPFDNAEVLNTELGSRLFRAFVQVNPVATGQALYRNFANKPLEEIIKIDEGRRNLVWALETLCFDKRTFIDAAKVLACFAAAENETWSNNSTGTFLHLFNIHLAGTEALLADRLKVINWAWQQKHVTFRQLAISAMTRGLNFGHFHRMGGSEKQGTRVLRDNVPTAEEIRAYWTAIVKLLRDIYFSKNEFSEKVAQILLDNLRHIASAGEVDIILPVVRDIATNKEFDWDEAIRPLKTMIKYEGQFLSDAATEDSTSLVGSLTKDDFVSKYTRLIINPQMDFIDDFSFENKERKIEELAADFVAVDLDWDNVIPMMASGYYYSAFIFGKTIFELLNEKPAKLDKFINVLIAAILAAEKEQRNLTVLGGMYQAAPDEIRKSIITKVEVYPELRYILFWLVPLSRTAFEETEQLFKLVDSGECSVWEFASFAQNGYIDADTLQLVEFCEKLFGYGREGYLVAFKIAQTAAFFNEQKTVALLPLLRQCILKIGIIHDDQKRSDDHQWWEIIRKILFLTDDPEFASLVNDSIIDSITWDRSYHLNNTMQNLYQLLVTKYFNEIWPALTPVLLAKNEQFVKFYGLKHILGSSNGTYRHTTGLLFKGDMDTIFNWCDANQPLAAIRLANLTPIFANAEDKKKTSWHPVARRLIDNFGVHEDVLRELSANMGSFSWTGSIIPYLQMQKELMEEIKDHPIAFVAEWSRRSLMDLDNQIRFEHDRDAEMSIR